MKLAVFFGFSEPTVFAFALFFWSLGFRIYLELGAWDLELLLDADSGPHLNLRRGPPGRIGCAGDLYRVAETAIRAVAQRGSHFSVRELRPGVYGRSGHRSITLFPVRTPKRSD